MNIGTVVRARRTEDVEYWNDLVREFERLLREVTQGTFPIIASISPFLKDMRDGNQMFLRKRRGSDSDYEAVSGALRRIIGNELRSVMKAESPRLQAVWFLRVVESYKMSAETRFYESLKDKRTIHDLLIPQEDAKNHLLRILPPIITSFKVSLGSDYRG